MLSGSLYRLRQLVFAPLEFHNAYIMNARFVIVEYFLIKPCWEVEIIELMEIDGLLKNMVSNILHNIEMGSIVSYIRYLHILIISGIVSLLNTWREELLSSGWTKATRKGVIVRQ